jgi:heat shock protein HslJ
MGSAGRWRGGLAAWLWLALAPVAAAPGPASLDGTAWVLSALRGKAPLREPELTLRFEKGRVAGSDGCNRYAAPFTQRDRSLQVSPRMIATQMACAPKLMDQAAAYRMALISARGFRLAEGRLRLIGADGTTLATFLPQSQSLAGSRWTVTGFNNGRQAVTSPLTGTTLSIDFAASGRLSGSAGCNRYAATAQMSGEKLSIGPPAATRRLCSLPPGIMEQEQQFLRALPTVATARQEGRRLELRRGDGALAVSLIRADDARLDIPAR